MLAIVLKCGMLGISETEQTKMDMSAAALPAKYGHASKKDERHHLFNLYQQHRYSCSKLMVDSSDFKDWLYQYYQNLVNEEATKKPEYKEFMKWMIENQGGARKCPAGIFPHNLYYWCNGGRW